MEYDFKSLHPEFSKAPPHGSAAAKCGVQGRKIVCHTRLPYSYFYISVMTGSIMGLRLVVL